jgi:glycosyltransferase involved in cell wall biosynthesis
MKILLLVHSLRKGGAERIVLELANGLIKLGHIVNIITWIDEDAFKTEYNSINRVSLLSKDQYFGLKSIPKSILPLRRCIKSLNPDIIHIHSPNMATLLSLTLIQIPAVHVIHGYGKISKNMKEFKNIIINFFDVFTSSFIIKNFVVVSKAMKIHAEKYYYFKKFNFSIIENGIDINKFDYKSKTINNNNINIIMIGTICENKGQYHALKILEILSNSNYLFNLTLVGDGPDADKLKNLISNSKICNLIKIISKADNINELLHDSDILWILSKSEAMPLVVLEAMACGVVVVGYDVRGVNDAVINNKTGILSDYKNYNKISDSTIFIVNNKIKKNNLSKMARKHIETNFSLNSMVIKYEEVSKKILYG